MTEPVRPAAALEDLIATTRKITADLTPLKVSQPYRRLFLGQTASFAGTTLTAVAIPLQVYAITQSTFAVGLLGLAALLPLVVGGLLGGTLADSVDRRRLALATSLCLGGLSALLVVQAALDLRQVWLLYVILALQSGLSGIDSPARQTMLPRLLPVGLIPAATALGQLSMNLSMVVGPLLAAALVAGPGYAWAYAVDTASFGFALWGLLHVPPMPPEGGGRRAGLASVVEGFAYLRGHTVVLMTFVVDLVAMITASPRALFPQLSQGVFGRSEGTAGLLFAAVAAGGLLGAVFGGWFGSIRRQGAAVLVGIVGYGLAIIGLGLAPALWVALVMLALAGAADMVSGVFRGTILQTATVDEVRGRLQGVFIVVVAGGPRLGDLQLASVSTATSPRVALVLGGAACVVITLAIAVLVPSFRRYDVEELHPLPPAEVARGGASTGVPGEQVAPGPP